MGGTGSWQLAAGSLSPMYSIHKDFTFSAAHQIRGHTGGCERLHGHNYRVRVCLAAESLDDLGMVEDFTDLKRTMEQVLRPFDHQLINDVAPFDEINTTAELLAEHVFLEVQDRLEDPDRVHVRFVEVWENDTSCARFEES